MPRTEEAEVFFAAVYQAIQEVPYGRVTSYGHIARLIGRPECPRQVGTCLKHLPSAADDPSGLFQSDTVPWQRVINSRGIISPRGEPSGTSRQAEALRAEGIEIQRGDLGELRVDLSIYGWFPEFLPSEEGDFLPT